MFSKPLQLQTANTIYYKELLFFNDRDYKTHHHYDRRDKNFSNWPSLMKCCRVLYCLLTNRKIIIHSCRDNIFSTLYYYIIFLASPTFSFYYTGQLKQNIIFHLSRKSLSGMQMFRHGLGSSNSDSVVLLFIIYKKLKLKK